MSLILTRQDVIELFCICRQAERSVHRALFAHWEPFRCFYGLERRKLLESWLTKLLDLVGCGAQDQSFADREAVLAHVREPGFFRVVFGGWFANRRKAWSFSAAELDFLRRTLCSLLDTVAQPVRPSADFLISLRMDFWSCWYVIDCRCHGLSALAKARDVEHFMQSPSIPHLSLQEICGSSAAPTPTRQRKTA